MTFPAKWTKNHVDSLRMIDRMLFLLVRQLLRLIEINGCPIEMSDVSVFLLSFIYTLIYMFKWIVTLPLISFVQNNADVQSIY